jgi:hypothetical protein
MIHNPTLKVKAWHGMALAWLIVVVPQMQLALIELEWFWGTKVRHTNRDTSPPLFIEMTG